MNEKLSQLKKQIDQIAGLGHAQQWGPEYELWKKKTNDLILEIFGQDYLKIFNGLNTVTFSYMDDDFNAQQYASELDKRKRFLDKILEENIEKETESSSTKKFTEEEILKLIWKNEQAIQENLLKTKEAEEIQQAIWNFLDTNLPSGSIVSLRYRKLREGKRWTWWSDPNGYPTSTPWTSMIEPFVKILEQFLSEKTIKRRLSNEEFFIESRSQGEDEHIFIGNKDGKGKKAHIIIDGKTGEIRVDDKDQPPEEVVLKIETVLTMPNGKKIKSSREALEELSQ
jgi:hypothetical protein